MYINYSNSIDFPPHDETKKQIKKRLRKEHRERKVEALIWSRQRNTINTGRSSSTELILNTKETTTQKVDRKAAISVAYVPNAYIGPGVTSPVNNNVTTSSSTGSNIDKKAATTTTQPFDPIRDNGHDKKKGPFQSKVEGSSNEVQSESAIEQEQQASSSTSCTTVVGEEVNSNICVPINSNDKTAHLPNGSITATTGNNNTNNTNASPSLDNSTAVKPPLVPIISNGDDQDNNSQNETDDINNGSVQLTDVVISTTISKKITKTPSHATPVTASTKIELFGHEFYDGGISKKIDTITINITAENGTFTKLVRVDENGIKRIMDYGYYSNIGGVDQVLGLCKFE